MSWFGAAQTPEQDALQKNEFDQRLAADLAWLDRTFAVAKRRHARAVVLAMQANVFVERLFKGADVSGFDAIVQRIADRAKQFGRPVLLLEGDTHGYIVDHPLTAGSPEHHVKTHAPNVTRIVVQGETADEWLRLHIDPRAHQPFTWTREQLPSDL